MTSPSALSDNFPWPQGKRCAVSLSFDDARESQVDQGIPLLDRHGVKGTFYVSLPAFQKRLADWKRAVDSGHEIGCHTVHHPCSGNFRWAREHALEEYDLARIERDIVEANDAITKALGRKPVTFAYPCGQTWIGRGEGHTSYVPVVARHFLIGRGYMAETMNDPAYCDLAHVFSPGMDGLPWARAKAMIDEAAQTGRWLIFTGHETSKGGVQATLLETLEAICAYAADASRGIWIDTVAAVGRHVAAQRTAVSQTRK